MVPMRAAASSMARGTPPRRMRIWATRGALAVQREVGLHRQGAVNEELHRLAGGHHLESGPLVGNRQGRDDRDLLASHIQTFPAGGQHLDPGTDPSMREDGPLPGGHGRCPPGDPLPPP